MVMDNEEQIDASLCLEQFVEKVIDYTSKFNSALHSSYSPHNLVGKCSKYPRYGDYPETYTLRCYGKWWKNSEFYQKPYMPQDIDPYQSEDYVMVRFNVAVVPEKLRIYETYSPGAVVRIWGRKSQQTWVLLWENMPQYCKSEARIYQPEIRKINTLINEIRLELNSEHLRHHACFDAILLVGFVPKDYPKTPMQEKLLSVFENSSKSKLNTKVENLTSELDCTTSGTNFIELLPNEVIIHIFQYLDLRSLSHCARVNKRWYQLSCAPILYQNLSLKRYWHSINSSTLNIFKERCNNIKKLDLSWCGNEDTNFSNNFCDLITNCCKNITHLSLCNCYFITKECMNQICNCKDLTELRLRKIPLTNNFSLISELTKLVILDLYSTNICDEDIIFILKRICTIRHINLDFCENLRRLDDVVYTLCENNKHIKSWSSWKTRSLTPLGVSYFARCPDLEELDLGWCLLLHHPGNSLEQIAMKCTKLKRLILSGWRGVTDGILRPIISSCKELHQLDLLGIKSISKDICEKALFTLPFLELLEISFCDSISNEQVAQWREQFPFTVIQRSCEYETTDFLL